MVRENGSIYNLSMPDRIHFITGRLAEHSLRAVLAELAPQAGFDYTVEVLNITVAALMTPEWVARRIHVSDGTTRVILPGYCEGDLAPVEAAAGVPVERGPRDLRRLPEFFGERPSATDYGRHDIQILAEINHAPRLQLADILAEAKQLTADGADVIDVGCDPGDPWTGVGETVRALRDVGHRVSIDSMNPREIEPAVRAGAELVLSVNASNREAARDWGCEVVVVPDMPAAAEKGTVPFFCAHSEKGDSPRRLLAGLIGLDETVSMLAEAGVRLRIDPVLEPIGFGFAASLERYFEVCRRWPDAEMMMGIGNLTELTDVDSAGVNVLLLAICEELGIRSVLTTQVIHWARSSVRECNLARRLVYHAIRHRILPKHVEPGLVMLRGGKPLAHGRETLHRLAAEIKDYNYRVFAEDEKVHVVSAGLHLADSDPFALFEQLLTREPKNLDASHAFYLGYEMAKAVTALTLSKDYRQDEALDWGFLTREEQSHRLKEK
jgi:dihydropteroate synthase-like protein